MRCLPSCAISRRPLISPMTQISWRNQVSLRASTTCSRMARRGSVTPCANSTAWSSLRPIPKRMSFMFRGIGIDQRIGSGGPSLLRQLEELVERSRSLRSCAVHCFVRGAVSQRANGGSVDRRHVPHDGKSPSDAGQGCPTAAARTIMSGGVARGDADMNAPLWAALVLAWEDQLIESSRVQDFRRRRGPDMTTVRWQQMGRDFLARAERECEEDPLAG